MTSTKDLRYPDTTANKSQAAVSKVTSGPITGARRGKRAKRVASAGKTTVYNRVFGAMSGSVKAKGRTPTSTRTSQGTKEAPL